MEGTIPRENGEVSIASYMNFLIVNGAVILPQYGDENDALAARQVQEMFPDREVVPVQTREVAFGGRQHPLHYAAAARGQSVKCKPPADILRAALIMRI